MLRDVIAVSRVGGRRLRLRFDDGVEGVVDIAEMIEFHGVFEPLRDPVYFAQVAVSPETGTIAWPNGADLDPVVLYREATGRGR